MPGGKPKDPDYFRKWRATHQENRKRYNERRNERRRLCGREDRTQEYARRAATRASRASTDEPLPPLHTGDDIFDHAKRLARCSPGFRYLTHPYYDDLIGEIVLALVERRSPTQARRAFLRREFEWRRYVAQEPDA